MLVMCGMLLGLQRVRKLSLPRGSHRTISHLLLTAMEVNALTTAMTLAVVISFEVEEREAWQSLCREFAFADILKIESLSKPELGSCTQELLPDPATS